MYTKINISSGRSKIYPKTNPLVKQVIYKDENLDKVAAVQWGGGGSDEENALNQFYAHEAGKHTDFKLLPACLFLDRYRAYTGVSPDASMHCKCHGQSIVEIKCPFNICDGEIKDNTE